MILVAALVLGQAVKLREGDVGYLPGQLEVVAGLRHCPDTVMALYYGSDVEPKFTDNKIVPGGYIGFNFGFVRFSTREEDFLGLPVWHVHWMGETRFVEGKKQYQVDAAVDYWVDMTGKIRRQSADSSGPLGDAQAQADYYPDHIEIKRTVKGKFEDQLLYPAANELEQLNDQFKPMVVHGKIVQRMKTYLVLDLYRGGFESRSARVGGMFDGVEVDTHFHGYVVNIEFNKTKQGVCVSDEDRLVRVDLQDGRAIVLNSK